MQYKKYILVSLLVFTQSLCYGSQQKDVQQKIDKVVTLSDAVLEKCKLLQGLHDSIKLHSQEIFAKLYIDEREIGNFEQKLAYLLDTIDPVAVGDMQSLLEKELFYAVNMDMCDCIGIIDEVAILKAEVLKYLVEGSVLKKIADSYCEHMLALGKSELAVKETFQEKLQRIKPVLIDIFDTELLMVGIGAGVFVMGIAACVLYEAITGH